jgi:hypothetical protein
VEDEGAGAPDDDSVGAPGDDGAGEPGGDGAGAAAAVGAALAVGAGVLGPPNRLPTLLQPDVSSAAPRIAMRSRQRIWISPRPAHG